MKTLTKKIDEVAFIFLFIALFCFIAATVNLINYPFDASDTDSAIEAHDRYIESLKIYIKAIKERMVELDEETENE